MASKAPRNPVPFMLPGGPREIASASRTRDGVTSQLIGFPRALTSFVGRGSEIAILEAFLTDPQQRRVSVLGPGGVGKTRLALKTAEMAADAFPDGVAFVALAGLSDPRQVAGEIATTLEILGQSDRSILQSIIAALDRSHLLLMLDNLEHLVGHDLQSLISQIMQSCPSVTILATSREPLQLGLEQRMVISPLQVPAAIESKTDIAAADSVQLFLARALAVAPEFAPDPEEVRCILEVCRRVDGLPLAIELAAAWTRVFSPAALLALLSETLPLLTGGSSDQPTRFRTMRDAIAWSFDRLPDAEAALLCQLSVFRGGFSLEAAMALSNESQPDASASTLHLVASLCDRNLLFRAGAVGEIQRFGILETIREFALERLEASGELPRVQASHAAYYQDLTERMEAELLGQRESFWFELLDAEASNIREAIAWGLEHDVERALRTLSALWGYWSWRAVQEGLRLLNTALNLPYEAHPHVRARALRSVCALANLSGDYEATAKFAAEARALRPHIEDRWIRGELFWNCGLSSVFTGDLPGAVQEIDQALPLMDQPNTVSERAIAAYVLSHRGLVAHMSGEHEAGDDYFAQCLENLRKTKSPTMLTIVLGDAAGWHLQANRIDSAQQLLHEALNVSRISSVGWAKVAPLIGLALVDAIEGRSVRASRRLGAVAALAARAGLASAPNFQGTLDQTKSLVINKLGCASYSTEWEIGRSNPAQVVEEAFAIASDESASIDDEMGPRRTRLTARELEVLGLIVSGRTDREISASLFISERTVSKHVSTILQKLDAVSRADAAVRAVRLGLV